MPPQGMQCSLSWMVLAGVTKYEWHLRMQKKRHFALFGNFHYVVMPFGLKNAGATYQRAMTAIFHDMIHDFVEDYVDDLVVKSKRALDHIMHLEKVFERCRKYKLKMNPKKCAFAVNTGKFLGVTVH